MTAGIKCWSASPTERTFPELSNCGTGELAKILRRYLS